MSEYSDLKSKTISNMLWKLFERVGAQLVSFIVQLVLARILEPEAFGTIAIINVFITLCNVFITNGTGSSLIQKKDADDVDFSSVLHFNFIISIILYIFMFACAPLIADFYQDATLLNAIRILSIQIPLSGIKTVQQAYVAKQLKFRLFFKATIIGTIISGFIGVYCAYQGYGIYALIVQYLSNSLIDIVILAFTIGFKPKCIISWKRLKPLLNYGWKILASSIINAVYNDLRSLVIGKYYSNSDLAFYNRGKQFPDLICDNTTVAIESVLFPVLSIIQNEKEQLKIATKRFIKTSSYIMTPLLFGLAAIAKPLIVLLLTEKWLFCVPYVRIFCVVYALKPMQTANLQVIKAVGRSDIFLKIEIIKKIIGITILVVSLPFGVYWVAIGMIIQMISACIINALPIRKILSYSFREQITDLIIPFIPAGLMCGIVVLIGEFPLSNILLLLVQITIGALVYIGLSAILHLDSYIYILNSIKEIWANHHK